MDMWDDEYYIPLLRCVTDKTNTFVFSKSACEEILEKQNLHWRDEYLYPLLLSLKIYPEYKFSDHNVKKLHDYRNKFFNIRHQTKQVMREMVKLSNKDIPKNDNYSRINLLISYYNIQNKQRKLEIDKAIQHNIDNSCINQIIIFLETEDANISRALRVLSRINFKNKVEVIISKKRMDYGDCISYAKKSKINGIVLISNSDCYFDSTVSLLKKIDYLNGRRILCMTRKDQLEDGSIRNAVMLHEQGYNNKDEMIYKFGKPSVKNYYSHDLMPPYSSDAWAFSFKSLNLLSEIKLDIELGRQHCEQIFQSKLHKHGFQLRNVGLGNHVRCIHIHNSGLRWKHSCLQNKMKFDCVVPFTENGEYISFGNLTEHNYINGTNISHHANNYFYDDRYKTNLGEFVVRDIKKLLKKDK